MNIVRLPLGDYATIFTESEDNIFFSIFTPVMIREAAFFFVLFVYSSETSRNRAATILKMIASVL